MAQDWYGSLRFLLLVIHSGTKEGSMNNSRELLRTPDECFKDLKDYPVPHYAVVDGLRIHYIDEGKS